MKEGDPQSSVVAMRHLPYGPSIERPGGEWSLARETRENTGLIEAVEPRNPNGTGLGDSELSPCISPERLTRLGVVEHDDYRQRVGGPVSAMLLRRVEGNELGRCPVEPRRSRFDLSGHQPTWCEAFRSYVLNVAIDADVLVGRLAPYAMRFVRLSRMRNAVASFVVTSLLITACGGGAQAPEQAAQESHERGCEQVKDLRAKTHKARDDLAAGRIASEEAIRVAFEQMARADAVVASLPQGELRDAAETWAAEWRQGTDRPEYKAAEDRLYGLCRIDGQSPPPATHGGQRTTESSSQPAPAPTRETTPAAVVLHLKSKGLPIGRVKTFSEADDPNSLLGRPGQYTGKANFHDTRLREPVNPGPCDPVGPGQDEPVCHDEPRDPEVGDGGSVEMFGTEGDAKRRFDYVSAIARSGGPFSEYAYVHGNVLLRISNELTPTQAREYEDALKSL